MTRTILVVAFAIGSACNCVLPARDVTVREVLEAQGYTNVEPGHVTPWGCSDSDTFTSTFEATGPTGKQVHGEVCCGWVKGCTVRVAP